jgi:hypothetical protein
MINMLITRNTIMLKPDPTTPDARPPTGERAPDTPLPLPAARCLTSEQAAAYLGIGVTLLADLAVPCVKLGRRRVYDKVDLDSWLDEHKRRGRAGKESQWPARPGSTGDGTLVSGGSTLYYPAAGTYASALGLKTGTRPKRSSRD